MYISGKYLGTLSTIQSATTFLEKCRKVVLEIWFSLPKMVWEKRFCKLGCFFWFEKSGWPEKQVNLYYKSTFFQVGEKWFCKLGFFFWFEKSGWPEKKIQVWRTTFLEPLFYTFLEKWLQIKWLSNRLPFTTWKQE